MSAAFVRNTLKKAGCINVLLGKQLKVVKCVSPIQVATLRATYGEPFGYMDPYPYKEKKLNVLTEWIEGTKKRLNENSKIILVDGNIAVGKNDFGSRLARSFDMRHYPSVSPDRAYVQIENGFDLRELNNILPPSCRFYDLNDFYTDPDPFSGRIGKMHIFWFMKRIENYCTACLHLLSTGQGIVISASVFSDIVYIEAMKKMGYITPNFHRWFKAFYEDTVCELLKPHLLIYLNAPIDVVKERIKKRNAPHEVSTKVLTDDYLKALDDSYKSKLLQTHRRTSEVIEIDWSEVGDDLEVDTIAEELESIVLENQDNEDPKFRDWRHYTEDQYAIFRRTYCRKESVQDFFRREMPYDCPEIVPVPEEAFAWDGLYFNHPAVRYKPGYMAQFSAERFVDPR